MAKKCGQVEAGTGNVFADLGYPDAKERTVKVQLAVEVNRILKERKLTQSRAADVLGIAQPHVSDLVRYRLDRFSSERLAEFFIHSARSIQSYGPHNKIDTQPIRRGLMMEIKPIKTEADYRAALREIEALKNARVGTPEGARLDVVVTLVEAYESKHCRLELFRSG